MLKDDQVNRKIFKCKEENNVTHLIRKLHSKLEVKCNENGKHIS